ncbi:putative protein rai1 [Diplodia seriata]|uniref:Decapping nuclease n=1 Tax=Diplodia seriata TaxID=420778 RepID=A0A0G2G874_9PEZI|nr:putative protein rai1 [Diplodia seriata]
MSDMHADGPAEGPAEGPHVVAEFDTNPNNNWKLFSDRPKNIHRPKEVAEFSYDENHQIHLDARSLSHYYPPQPHGAEHHLYLDKGLESFRLLDDSQDGHLTGLLTAIMDMEQKQGAKTDADFVAYRGMITNGTIFIEEDKAAKLERKARQASKGPADERKERLQYYYGFKFETLYTIPDIWDNVSRDEIESRDDKVVSNYAQYCSVVETGVGKLKMVIGGEVDCRLDGHIRNSTGVWKLTKKQHDYTVRLIHFEKDGTGEILTDSFKAHRLVMAQQSLLARVASHG